MILDEKQREAVDLCLDRSKRIVAITGAAGTGKTTIIREVAQQLKLQKQRVAVCAPTGKAARRITEATGEQAVTMHRLLEYPRPGERDPETGKPLHTGSPKRDRDYPLEYDVVIADEYAMVNHELDRNLIDALRSGARLLVFGDINQLAPIEPHKVKTTSETPFQRHLKRASVTLEHVFRQAEDGGILESANRIRKGTMPKRYVDFTYNFTDRPVDYIKRYVIDILDEEQIDFRLLNNQIIVPMRKGWIGTHAINRVLRDYLNPDGVSAFSLELPRHDWEKENPVHVSEGDKVVCTENTYDMRDYYERYGEMNDKGIPVESSFIETPPSKMMLNGETGIITKIDDDGSLHIDMGDRTVDVPSTYAEYSWQRDSVFDKDPRKSIELAYALTTHKCQGSEFDRVIYLINKSCNFMLNRKNFYTAVTRAKKHVLVVSDQKAIQMALRPEIRL